MNYLSALNFEYTFHIPYQPLVIVLDIYRSNNIQKIYFNKYTINYSLDYIPGIGNWQTVES